MKIVEFIKREASDWNIYEIFGLLFIIAILLYNILHLHDNLIAAISSICGILYTIFAGKGKIYCYFIGLLGSGCYVALAYMNAVWGNALLYLLYYIPMQVLGIFKWKNHLKINTAEIIKSKLSNRERFRYFIIGFLGSILTILILKILNDVNPVIDGITTFLSILGMYFTVKRLIEQWIVWMVVNGLSFIMWLFLIINGTKAYSTLVMWGVYFILAIYFYILWKKELKDFNTPKL